MDPRTIPVVLALATLAGPPVASASAKTLVSDRFPSAASPVLAGDRVVWGETSSGLPFSGGSLTVRSRVPGQAERRLIRFQRSESFDQFLTPLVASPSALGINRVGTRSKTETFEIPRERHRGRRGRGGFAVFGKTDLLRRRATRRVSVEAPVAIFSDLRAGPPDGPFRRLSKTRSRLERCDGPSRLIDGQDATGSEIVSIETTIPCRRGGLRFERSSSRVLAQRVDDPGAAPVELARQGGGDGILFTEFGVTVRAAGPYIAFAVADPDTGDPAIRVLDRSGAAPARDIPANRIGAFDVDDDGTLALTRFSSDSESSRVGYVVPGTTRFVSLPGRGGFEVRIAAGRIAYQRFESTRSPANELVVADLSGNLRSIASFGKRRQLLGGAGPAFDIAPDSIVWSRFGNGPRARSPDARAPGAIFVESLAPTAGSAAAGIRR